METKSEIKNKIQAYLAQNDLQFESLGENEKVMKPSLLVTQSEQPIDTFRQALDFLNLTFDYPVNKESVKFDRFSLPEFGIDIKGWIYAASEGYYFIKLRSNQLYLVDRRFFE